VGGGDWRVGYRDGLDAATPPGAGPAGAVQQEAAHLPLHARRHLTPLAAPHDARCVDRREAPARSALSTHSLCKPFCSRRCYPKRAATKK